MSMLPLSCLCLDFDTAYSRYHPAWERFLGRNREALGLSSGGEALNEYLDRVYPDGVPGSAIISNIGLNGRLAYLIRPSVEGPLAASFAAGAFAPAFRVHPGNGRGVLAVWGMEVAPHIEMRTYESGVSAPIFRRATDQRMRPEDFSALSTLSAHRRETNGRLEPWIEYIEWRKKLAHEGRLAVPFDRVAYDGDGVARFFVRTPLDQKSMRRRLGVGVLLAVPRTASRNQERWDPDRSVRTSKHKLGEVLDFKRATANGRPGVGIAELVVNMDGIDVEDIPASGFLLTPVGGKLRPLENELEAIRRLRNDQGYSPYLSSWLFDIGKAAVPDAIADICSADPAFAHLNADQVAAVNKVMAAPEVVLIQGPPGTGKTTVIGAISRIAIDNGLRVLVVSQTNLAVDNALDRNAGRVGVRPLRVGREERVAADYRALLPDKAVARWLKTVRAHAQQQLATQADRRRTVRRAEERLGALRTLLERFNDGRARVAEIERTIEGLQDTAKQLSLEAQTARDKEQRQARSLHFMRDVLGWMNDPSRRPPNVDHVTNDQVAKRLLSAMTRIRRSLPKSDWNLPWNVTRARSAAGAVQAIHETAMALTAAQPLLTTVGNAVAMCADRRRPTSTGSQELAALRAEKRLLIDAESDSDLQRLATINRRIKTLQNDQWSRVCRDLDDQLSRFLSDSLPDELDELVSSLGPVPRWSNTLNDIAALAQQMVDRGISRFEKTLGDVRASIAEIVVDAEVKAERDSARCTELHQQVTENALALDEASSKLSQEDKAILKFEQRWAALWTSVCPDCEGTDSQPASMDRGSLDDRTTAFEQWRSDNNDRWAREARLEPVLTEWVRRLGEPDAGKNQAIRSLYNENANVVGMTCNESANRDLWEDPRFAPYDIVIIDEVSKATPTELLMPMLLGRKTVLCGDHRQLPPMLYENEQSFAESIEEGTVDPADFRRFENMVTAGFFEELFEDAPDSIRHSLTSQYRMHSQIMAVINVFYDRMLESGGGAVSLDRQRQHYLSIRDRQGGKFLEPKHHVLWIDSTHDHRKRRVLEQAQGTSKSNPLEVDLIMASLGRMQESLRTRGYGFVARATASARESGITAREWVQRLHPRAKDATIAEGFSQGRIRINAKPTLATHPVRTGDALAVDLRKSVGVITFYGAQLREIRRRIQIATQHDEYALSTMDIQCNTVDRFQGMECAIVLVSLVRTRKSLGSRSFVNQFQRINVAFSRARELLVIVGAEATFRDALLELPGMNGGPKRKVYAYRNIFDLVKRFGGRRYADQLLG